MKISLCVLIIVYLPITSGCYLSASISDLTPKSSDIASPINKVNTVQASEFVSGSDKYQTTLINRYKILSSAGSFNRELVNKTPKGYKIYSSVQGALISGQESAQ